MRRLLLLPLVAACAVTPRYLPPDPPRTVVLAPIDWNSAGNETVRVLQEYLRIDTSNPPGREIEGARYLAKLLADDGIASEILEETPGRANLVARLKGSGEEAPLCLLSHIDVASAEAGEWPRETGPFSGAIDAQGRLWGRGALDMKGLGAIELQVMRLLKRAQVPLRRDVILIAVADEEVGNGGMRFLTTKHWKELGCSQLVNEGGIGIRDLLFPGQTVFTVSTAEKGLLWLRMTAHGASGHGSTPLPGRAPERLLKAIARLAAREDEPRIVPTMYQMLRQIGEQKGGFTGYVLNRPFLVDHLVTGKLLKQPAARAGITNTVQITGFSGALEPNVVPSEVSAQLDCRLLPGVKPRDFLQELVRTVDDPQVTFEVLEEADANESPVDDPFYAALSRAAKQGRDDVVVAPLLSPGFTDSLLARPLGVHAYGFVPLEVTKEEAATMHGANERVQVDSVKRGVKVLFEAVAEVAAARAP